jgi:2-polyprenyl-3-methyl-5-hydroxy-6-metoxy-1,4-benzoquinol methylase
MRPIEDIKNKKINKILLQRGKTILDVGFAENPNPYLKGKIYGLDMLRVKKPKNYYRTIVFNLNQGQLPFNKPTFDIVLLGDVIEHVENPSLLLRESNRVLKTGKTLVVSTPHANHWFTTIHNWFLPFVKDHDDHQHLSNWPKLDMIRLLRLNGFEVEQITGLTFDVPLLRVHFPCPYHMMSQGLIYVCRKTRSLK